MPSFASAVAVPASTKQISYTDLYARWEKGNWCATEIDFTQDEVDWRERMTEDQRRGALWLYSLFFHGEDSVTDNLSPYIDAAPLEEQKYFLATQQVDEARHSVFFKRFMEEVVGAGSGTTADLLAATEPNLGWGHRKVFGRLDQMADELRADRSKRKLAEAVTLYHLIVEASLAQPGQHMIDTSLERLDLLPGFRSGMANVAMDEQRHIAFGVRLLSELLEEDPETIAPAIVGTIRETLAWTTATAWPPRGDLSYTESFGFTVTELFEEGARAQEARLRAVGLKLEEIPRFPLPIDQTPAQRAQRGMTLLGAGYLGEPNGPITHHPEATRLLFDGVRRVINADAVPPGTVIQWEFSDAPDWHLRLDNGSTSAAEGRVTRPDITLRMAFADWVDLTAGRVEPRSLLLRGRLRPKGDPRLLLRLPKLFG